MLVCGAVAAPVVGMVSRKELVDALNLYTMEFHVTWTIVLIFVQLWERSVQLSLLYAFAHVKEKFAHAQVLFIFIFVLEKVFVR